MDRKSFEEGDIPEYARSLASMARQCHEKVTKFLTTRYEDGSFQQLAQRETRHSMGIVEVALSRYKVSELAVSYNGGKDCLVLLVILLASLHGCPEVENGEVTKIPAFYGTPPDSFPEVESFVRKSELYYHLALNKFEVKKHDPNHSLKANFQRFLDDNPNTKAIFIGTRRSDPYGERLKFFSPTDGGWPEFMRIHSVVEWRYAEIWAFTKALDLDYCCLYDEGYTSLGGVKDTLPNPKLLISDGDGGRYHPAYILTADEDERLGRVSD
ncbi:FAD synthetase [Aspergillus granulosus]|uniref:FAD synthase n=1 Tax=Aspergillus granulosus TaxID=176169 RepID=A0ABR4I5S4_9EURO